MVDFQIKFQIDIIVLKVDIFSSQTGIYSFSWKSQIFFYKYCRICPTFRWRFITHIHNKSWTYIYQRHSIFYFHRFRKDILTVNMSHDNANILRKISEMAHQIELMNSFSYFITDKSPNIKGMVVLSSYWNTETGLSFGQLHIRCERFQVLVSFFFILTTVDKCFVKSWYRFFFILTTADKCIVKFWYLFSLFLQL